MRTPAVLLAVLAALAGCSDGGGAGDGPAGPSPDGGVPMLHGYVVDNAIRPLEGVLVTVLDTNSTSLSTAGGFYGFEDLPTDQFLILVASKDGFQPQSKQITLAPDTPVRLNFTLDPVPVRSPSSAVIPFTGIVGCQVATVGPGGNNTQDCNMGLEQVTRFDFSVDAELAGAVLEVFWEPMTPAGTSMGLRVETLELGQLNAVLGEVVGPSPLRVTVPQSAAERYYPGGGQMRISVYAASDATQNEAGIGASAVVRQPFEAYASLFYIDPPPGAYTIAG